MSSIYEVQVTSVLAKTFLIQADSQELAEDYAEVHLVEELDLSDWVERTNTTEGIYDSVDDIPLANPDIISTSHRGHRDE